MAGEVGVEPTPHGSKPCVLPLYYSPIFKRKGREGLGLTSRRTPTNIDVGTDSGIRTHTATCQGILSPHRLPNSDISASINLIILTTW